jgi:hypothetical protein
MWFHKFLKEYLAERESSFNRFAISKEHLSKYISRHCVQCDHKAFWKMRNIFVQNLTEIEHKLGDVFFN